MSARPFSDPGSSLSLCLRRMQEGQVGLPNQEVLSATLLILFPSSHSDCYHSQKCIDNGKEPSFCAQLWVDDLPKPGEKDKKKKKKPSPTQHLNPSSLAPSSMIMAPSSMIMAPSSMVMAPSSMLMGPPMPTPKKQIPAVTPKAQPPKQAPKAAPKAEAPKAEQSPKQASHEPKKEPKESAPKPTNSA